MTGYLIFLLKDVIANALCIIMDNDLQIMRRVKADIQASVDKPIVHK